MKAIKFFVMTAVASVLLGGLGFVAVAAAEEGNEYASIDVRLQGQNYCVGCTLGKAGANSACSVVGHRHALMISKAFDAAGKELPKLNGKTVHYIYNTKGKEYTEGHHGEKLEVSGKLFVNQHVLDIAGAKLAKDEGSSDK